MSRERFGIVPASVFAAVGRGLITHADLTVFAATAMYAGDGVCFAAEDSMTTLTGLTTGSLRNSRGRLVKAGLIERVGGGNRGSTAQYRIAKGSFHNDPKQLKESSQNDPLAGKGHSTMQKGSLRDAERVIPQCRKGHSTMTPKRPLLDHRKDHDKNQESAATSSATPDDVFDYFRASNATTKPRQLTETRRKKIAARLRDPDWPWREAIDRLPIPNDDRFTWQPDLDWLLSNDTNAAKVAEGKYDRSSTATPPPKHSGPRLMTDEETALYRAGKITAEELEARA